MANSRNGNSFNFLLESEFLNALKKDPKNVITFFPKKLSFASDKRWWVHVTDEFLDFRKYLLWIGIYSSFKENYESKIRN